MMFSKQQAANWRKILRTALDLFKVPPQLKTSQWADEFRFLSSEASSRQGKWRSFPFQREPMDAPLDFGVSSTVLEWASQVCGKTEVVNNIIGRHIHVEPCPMLLIQPTVDLGKIWSKDRLAPMLRDTPVLRGRVASERSRDSKNTIIHKAFAGGRISIAGANAPAGLSGRPIKIVCCDEVDRYPESAGKEGDPVALAEKRTESFPDAIKILTSTPTIEGLSRIDTYFKLTDRRYFFVPPPCGHMQRLRWEGDKAGDAGAEKYVVWPEGKPAEAMMKCQECGALYNDEQRIAAIWDPRAEWRPTAPFTGARGYHLNGLYCLFKPQRGYRNRLHQFAAKFIEANEKGEETLKTWVNTFLAETWKEKGRDKDHQELIGRCESYEILPEEALFWLTTADVQEDRIELEKRAFGMGEESWGISYEILMGNTEFDPVWDALLNTLLAEYPHPCGKRLKCAITLIDCAYRPKRVLSFVKRCQQRGLNVYACMGSKTPWDEKLVSRPSRSVKQRATWFKIGTDHAKVTLFERLDVAKPGPRFMHFPIGRGYDEAYFKGLTAEKLVLHFKNDILTKREWRKKRDRNEPTDLNAYALGGVDILNPNWDALAKNLAVTGITPTNTVANESTKDSEPDKPKVNPRRFTPGFVQNWKRR